MVGLARTKGGSRAGTLKKLQVPPRRPGVVGGIGVRIVRRIGVASVKEETVVAGGTTLVDYKCVHLSNPSIVVVIVNMPVLTVHMLIMICFTFLFTAARVLVRTVWVTVPYVPTPL